MNSTFSYNNYREIINKYRPLICDFNEIEGKKEFALLRHDVEFSMERAHQIAKVDNECKVKSSFLFQVKSNAYNIFSNENQKILRQILEFGHKVGLHLYISHVKEHDWSELSKELSRQRKLFEIITKIKIDRFSYHRPPIWVLKNRHDKIEGLINMYGPSYFEFSQNP